MEKRRVVVTGLGAMTPIGHNVEETWKGIEEGVCGIAPITLFDATDMKVKVAGEIKDFHVEDYLDKKAARKMDRFTQLGMIAAQEAMEFQGGLVIPGGVLAAPVGMGDQPRRGTAPPDRHGEGRDDQIAGYPLRHGPAHHRAGIDIQYHR